MYSYETERPKLFTDEGQRGLLKTRDRVQHLLKTAGACRMSEIITGDGASDSWESLARVDRLVEIGEIREITAPGEVGQHRVFVAARG